MNLTTATPAEIDEAWAPLAAKTAEIRNLRYGIQEAARAVSNGWNVNYVQRQLAKRIEELPKIEERLDNAIASEIPYRREWQRRGGWTRGYLVVTNGQGHLHRTTSCSTCYPTTLFSWITEVSGKDEQEIVDYAGERACTVCYASAPVELRLDRPTQAFSADERAKAAARAEREAKRAAADVEKIVVEGYYDHSSHPRQHTFKTARGATNAIAGNLTSLTWYGEGHPSARQWISDVNAVREALAAKGIDYDYDKALAAARKKAVRDGLDQARY